MDYDELAELKRRLLRGYGSSAGRAEQVNCYQLICEEAADAIVALQARVAEVQAQAVAIAEQSARNKDRAERAESDLAAARKEATRLYEELSYYDALRIELQTANADLAAARALLQRIADDARKRDPLLAEVIDAALAGEKK